MTDNVLTVQPEEQHSTETSKNGPLEKMGSLMDSLMQAQGNHACKKIYRSKASIEKENKRQRDQNRFIIHPFSAFRWWWDLVMVLTLILTLIVIPLEIAFFTERHRSAHEEEAADHATTEAGHEGTAAQAEAGRETQDWLFINAVVDILFHLDLILNFRTAYVHPATEEVIFDNKKIALRYIKSWFFIDFVSSIPWDYLYNRFFGHRGDESVALTLRVLKLAKMLSLLRILRVARLMRYINQLEEFIKIEATVISIFHLITVTVIFCHWNACIQYLVAFVTGFPESSWVVKFHIHGANISVWEKYSFAIYRSVGHMLSMGFFQHGPPTTLSELWVGIISFILGGVFYALFIAHISNLIMSMNLAGRKYEQKVAEVREYMRFRKVPSPLQFRVLDYYDHLYQGHFFDERGILYEPNMSPILREEILLHNCRNLVMKVKFLQDAPREALRDLIQMMRFNVFFQGDHIIQAGRRGDCMYIIEHGLATVRLPNGTLVHELTDGDHFGEMSLMLDQRRSACVVALETCDVYLLHKHDLDLVLIDHPRLKRVLEEEAKRRMAEDGMSKSLKGNSEESEILCQCSRYTVT